MAALRARCNGTGVPDFSGLQIGDYLDGIDLSAIPAGNGGTAGQPWNNTYKNNRITLSAFNPYKGAGDTEINKPSPRSVFALTAMLSYSTVLLFNPTIPLSSSMPFLLLYPGYAPRIPAENTKTRKPSKTHEKGSLCPRPCLGVFFSNTKNANRRYGGPSSLNSGPF
jgi:hypothetical protein